MNFTKEELLQSPERKDIDMLYDEILLVPTGTAHESGFMHIAVIGGYRVDEEMKYEKCGYPDDISCFFPTYTHTNSFDAITMAKVRMDCYYPQGVLRYHGRGKFKVSYPLSSIDITFIEI